MRVLFLAHRIPYPPNKGDKIRSYHLLAHLSKQAEVDLVTHVDDLRDLRHRQILADMCRRVEIFPLNAWIGKFRALFALITNQALSVAYMTRPATKKLVERLLRTESYDLIIGYSSQVAAYLPKNLRTPVILDFVDVDSEKWHALSLSGRPPLSWVHGIEARRLRRFEAQVGERADGVVLTTPHEVDVYQTKVGKAALSSISIGVRIPETTPVLTERTPGLMIFVGAMDYPPNVQAAEIAAREILPLVQKSIPSARFRIVGRHPTARVRALADLPGVEVTGEVPDLDPHLRAASLAMVPLQIARGIQNKVLEALAAGIPVVSTPQVLSCLSTGADRCVVVANSNEALAARAIEILETPSRAASLAAAALDYVRREHNWPGIDEAWDALFSATLQGSRSIHQRKPAGESTSDPLASPRMGTL